MRSKQEAEETGGEVVKEDPLITQIGVGGVQAIASLLDQFGNGLIMKNQLIAILTSIFGLTESQAEQIASN